MKTSTFLNLWWNSLGRYILGDKIADAGAALCTPVPSGNAYQDQIKRKEAVLSELERWWEGVLLGVSGNPMRAYPGHQICACCAIDGVHRPFQESNLEHIAEYLSERPDGLEFVQSIELDGKHELESILMEMKHAYRTRQKEGEPCEARELRPTQLLRCYLMLEALRNPSFTADVGRLIDKNPKDGKSELGGLVRYGNGLKRRLELFEIPSHDPSNKSFSLSVRDQASIPHIAAFHLHALREDCTKYAGPSHVTTGFNHGTQTDIGSALAEAECAFESHHFVFTKLRGKRFNVDYYGARMGNFYAHPFILDLGNYEYNAKQ